MKQEHKTKIESIFQKQDQLLNEFMERLVETQKELKAIDTKDLSEAGIRRIIKNERLIEKVEMLKEIRQ